MLYDYASLIRTLAAVKIVYSLQCRIQSTVQAGSRHNFRRYESENIRHTVYSFVMDTVYCVYGIYAPYSYCSFEVLQP